MALHRAEPFVELQLPQLKFVLLVVVHRVRKIIWTTPAICPGPDAAIGWPVPRPNYGNGSNLNKMYASATPS